MSFVSKRVLDALDVAEETDARFIPITSNGPIRVVDAARALQYLRGFLSVLFVRTPYGGVSSPALCRHVTRHVDTRDGVVVDRMASAATDADRRLQLCMARAFRVRTQHTCNVHSPLLQPVRGLRHVPRYRARPDQVLISYDCSRN